MQERFQTRWVPGARLFHNCIRLGVESGERIPDTLDTLSVSLDCFVECERPAASGAGYWGTVLLGVLTGIVGSARYLHAEVRGRELVVEAPLRVCADCKRGLSRTTRRKELRALLETVPEYAELLAEYPKAGLGVG